MTDSVSVIIPTYNRAALLPMAVQSALDATVPGDEIIVVDDGSTDHTRYALEPFRGLVHYHYTDNSGPGAARNIGIGLASNPLVAFLDSDDEWLPDKLYIQRRVMSRFPELIFCFTNVLARLADGLLVHDIVNLWRHDEQVGSASVDRTWDEILDRRVTFSSIAPLPKDRTDFFVFIGNLYANLMEAYSVWTCAVMVRKEAAGASFRFPEDLKICEDWECFARLAKIGPVAYLDAETAIQNVHREPRLTDVSYTSQATARITLLKRIWGNDASFLATHSDLYNRVLEAQYLKRARYLIKEGRLTEAAEDLRAAGAPWQYRVLTWLPGFAVRDVLWFRQRVRAHFPSFNHP